MSRLPAASLGKVPLRRLLLAGDGGENEFALSKEARENISAFLESQSVFTLADLSTVADEDLTEVFRTAGKDLVLGQRAAIRNLLVRARGLVSTSSNQPLAAAVDGLAATSKIEGVAEAGARGAEASVQARTPSGAGADAGAERSTKDGAGTGDGAEISAQRPKWSEILGDDRRFSVASNQNNKVNGSATKACSNKIGSAKADVAPTDQKWTDLLGDNRRRPVAREQTVAENEPLISEDSASGHASAKAATVPVAEARADWHDPRSDRWQRAHGAAQSPAVRSEVPTQQTGEKPGDKVPEVNPWSGPWDAASTWKSPSWKKAEAEANELIEQFPEEAQLAIGMKGALHLLQYKRHLCPLWQKGRKCWRDRKCTYAHGKEELLRCTVKQHVRAAARAMRELGNEAWWSQKWPDITPSQNQGQAAHGQVAQSPCNSTSKSDSDPWMTQNQDPWSTGSGDPWSKACGKSSISKSANAQKWQSQNQEQQSQKQQEQQPHEKQQEEKDEKSREAGNDFAPGGHESEGQSVTSKDGSEQLPRDELLAKRRSEMLQAWTMALHEERGRQKDDADGTRSETEASEVVQLWPRWETVVAQASNGVSKGASADPAGIRARSGGYAGGTHSVDAASTTVDGDAKSCVSSAVFDSPLEEC
eukprot:TRINITY_DN23758_c0_g1_i1.p1 TRINITY_DN23758_c0_g1~~TRINITY_DN23758_c0_g1_i1.p1  ORF type:complete len:657 (+),score=117.24 TRINITY_DN23758_c0_g1_i1:30-1973(+)